MKAHAWTKTKLGMTALVAAVGLTACGGNNAPANEAANAGNNTAGNATEAPANAPAEKYTLTFFTNNSDRTVGQGKMEQELIDKYMQENPNVTIDVETLSPDTQFQDKIKVYNASSQLPDIISSWGNNNYLKPLAQSGALAEIDRASLGELGFIDAALDGFSIDGKLYGFPRNSDFWVLFYNKKIFADNGITPPTTEAELLKAAEVLKSKKIVPVAMDGREAWTSGLWYDTMLQRVSGSWDNSKKAMDGTGTFNDASGVAAAASIKKWVDAGVFGSGFLNQDYGAARNMFGQGKAAMFMMGQWEMGMASDENFPAEVRDNIGAIAMPTVEGGKGTLGDLTAWFGGGYSVSEKSEHKEEAIAFLTWMFKPENWAKGVWQNGITFPAQKYDAFMTGSETPVQQDLSKLFNEAASYSGTVAQDKFTADTQKTYYDSLQQLEGGKLSPEEFAKTIDDAAKKSLAAQ
jgi:raffinose/stachyose/melibiose transport system substrate-binding protein